MLCKLGRIIGFDFFSILILKMGGQGTEDLRDLPKVRQGGVGNGI